MADSFNSTPGRHYLSKMVSWRTWTHGLASDFKSTPDSTLMEFGETNNEQCLASDRFKTETHYLGTSVGGSTSDLRCVLDCRNLGTDRLKPLPAAET